MRRVGTVDEEVSATSLWRTVLGLSLRGQGKVRSREQTRLVICSLFNLDSNAAMCDTAWFPWSMCVHMVQSHEAMYLQMAEEKT